MAEEQIADKSTQLEVLVFQVNQIGSLVDGLASRQGDFTQFFESKLTEIQATIAEVQEQSTGSRRIFEDFVNNQQQGKGGLQGSELKELVAEGIKQAMQQIVKEKLDVRLDVSPNQLPALKDAHHKFLRELQVLTNSQHALLTRFNSNAGVVFGFTYKRFMFYVFGLFVFIVLLLLGLSAYQESGFVALQREMASENAVLRAENTLLKQNALYDNKQVQKSK